MERKKSKWIKWSVGIIIIAFFLVWTAYYPFRCPRVEAAMPMTIYASQCDDPLEEAMVKAIDQSKQSLFVSIYSLSDQKVVRALNRAAKRGVHVTVLTDRKTYTARLSRLIERKEFMVKGLMHQKILVSDNKRVWVGSANFTRASLTMHDNLVLGGESVELAETIVRGGEHPHFTLGGQRVAFFNLPFRRHEALNLLLESISEAQRSIKVAMFTLTHPKLITALIEAADRGVDVQVVVDHSQASGVCKKYIEPLSASEVELRHSRGAQLFHHKFMLVDNSTLIGGSTNWTKAAFSKNRECMITLYDLTNQQQKKMRQLWKIIRCQSYSRLHLN